MLAPIVLPWPDRRLAPNARGHWSKKVAPTKKARLDASNAARAVGIRKIEAEALRLTIAFFPPDRRPRDTDNMLSSLKASLDGIADITGIDDSRWSLVLRREAPRPPHGAVEIQIEVAA